MATNRRRELWRDRATGDAFAVELEGDRVLAAVGPIDPDDVDRLHRVWEEAAQGRQQAFTGLSTDLDRRRDEFERGPYPEP